MREHRRRLYAEAVSDAGRAARVGGDSRAGSGTFGTPGTFGTFGTFGTQNCRRLCAIGHRAFLTRRSVPKRRGRSERL